MKTEKESKLISQVSNKIQRQDIAQSIHFQVNHIEIKEVFHFILVHQNHPTPIKNLYPTKTPSIQ